MLVGLLVGCAAGAAPDDPPVDGTELGRAAITNVEIKMALAEVETGPAMLGLLPGDVERRDVTFYDTSELTLFGQGLILRTRRGLAQEDGDATVKIRPLSSESVAPSFVALDGFKCELDRSVGGRSVSSCSLTVPMHTDAIGQAALGALHIEALFMADQQRFLSAQGRRPDWSYVRAFGPIAAEVWKIAPAPLEGEKVTLERWTVPAGPRSLEASIKVEPSKASAFEKRFVEWIASRGVHASAEQETKTKAALTALARR
jgi:hypothetical protein